MGVAVDGHHLNLHCLVIGDQVVMTPMFMGAEPTHAPFGKYAGTRVFEAEELAALSFVRGLTNDQAVLLRSNERTDLPHAGWRTPEDHVQAQAFSDNLVLACEGLRAHQLTRNQQQELLGLIEVYVGRMRPGHDRVRMAEV